MDWKFRRDKIDPGRFKRDILEKEYLELNLLVPRLCTSSSIVDDKNSDSDTE